MNKFAFLGYVLTIGLLIAVFFLAEDVKGAKRWLNLYLFRLQPIELLKPFFILATVKILTLNKIQKFNYIFILFLKSFFLSR